MGKPAVIVSVEKQPNVDTIALTREIERALTEITPTLPQGIKADQIVFRQAEFHRDLDRQRRRRVLMEAGIVVAVVLFAFLLNWRTTAISLTAIPVSILATAVDLPLRRPVDQHHDARRPRHRHRRTGRRRRGRCREHLPAAAREPRAAAIRARCSTWSSAASQEVRSGIVYATAIIVLVFVPLFALSGIEGRLFAPLGHRLHRLDPGEPRGVDHADAGDGLLPAAAAEAPRSSATARWCAGSSAATARAAASAPSAIGAR